MRALKKLGVVDWVKKKFGALSPIDRVRSVLEFHSGGVYKRIDENRELLENIQQQAPEFLKANPWIEGWISSQDHFLQELIVAAEFRDNRMIDDKKYTSLRPWPKTTTQANDRVNIAKKDVSDFALLTSSQCVDPQFRASYKSQDYTVITGRAGSGKTMRGVDLILNALREGKAVQVLDSGRSYFSLCKAVGGMYITHQSEFESIEKFDHVLPLMVYDVEEISNLEKKLTPISWPIRPVPGALLLVDELWQMVELFPDLQTHIENHLRAGGSVALLCQEPCSTLDEVFQHFWRTDIPTVRKSLVSIENK